MPSHTPVKRRRRRSNAGRPVRDPDMRTFPGRVGERIRAIRVAKGLTQEEAAGRTDGILTAAMWSCYEVGKSEPRLSKYLSICMALGVKITDLVPEDAMVVVRDRSRDPEDAGRVFGRGE